MTVQKCCLTLGWDTIGWDNISPDVHILGIDLSPVGELSLCTKYHYVRHKAQMHENRRFFSTGMEYAKTLYAYVFKARSRN